MSALRRLTGGASRITWSFEAESPGGTRRQLVARQDRPGGLGAASRVEQALLALAAAGGVPVPAVVAELDSGYVMEHVEGETIPRRVLRDPEFAAAHPRMARQAGEVAARIHALPLAELAGEAGFEPPADPAQTQIGQYRDLLDTFGEPHPVFEVALRWLADHAPIPLPPALVHGDFRLGNFVVGPEGIRAVLDWELAHAGDPTEDLGWLCAPSWRFRRLDRRVGGFGDAADLLEGYRAVAGDGAWAADPDRLRYWEVFATLKWGEMCIVQAFTHLSGAHRSVELAAIGRRVCETEWQLLDLLDAPG